MTKFVLAGASPGPVAGLMGDPTSKGKVKVGEGRGDGPRNLNFWIHPDYENIAQIPGRGALLICGPRFAVKNDRTK